VKQTIDAALRLDPSYGVQDYKKALKVASEFKVKSQKEKDKGSVNLSHNANRLLSGVVEYIEQKDKISEVISKLEVKAVENPYKVLIFTRALTFCHDSIAYGAGAVRDLGVQKNLYQSTITGDPSVFEDAENLMTYDAIVMMSTTGEPVPKGQSMENFKAFIASGKSLIGIHAAADCHRQWPDYLEMIGGNFAGHPWGAGHTVTLYNEDPEHPVAKAIPQGFRIRDEIYQYRDDEHFTREKLRVLISLDLSGEGMLSDPKVVKRMNRKDFDYPVSWIKEIGGSRIFYSNLGHNTSTYLNPVAMQHFADGIQYALGLIKADARPSAVIGKGPKAPPEQLLK
jgi:type 1 glutamine amidotransferase